MNPAQEVEAARHLARALGLPFVDLKSYRISPGILRKLPSRGAVELRCVPMISNPRRVVLVIDDPAALAILASRRDLTGGPRGRPLEFALTTPSALEETLQRRSALPGAG
jgi:hypothetical protein